MPARIEGYITVDASDYSDDLEIYADAEDIVELMEFNEIHIDQMMELYEVKLETSLSDIKRYLDTVADDEDLAEVVGWCIKRFQSDLNNTFKQMVDNRRDADQAKAEIKVLTATPVKDSDSEPEDHGRDGWRSEGRNI